MLGVDDEPLVLQLKEAGESVLEGFAGRSRLQHHGQRVVAGQQLLQRASDVFLGWTRIPNPMVRTGTSTFASSGTGRSPPT